MFTFLTGPWAVVLSWGDYASRGPLAMSGDIFGCQKLGWREVLLAASGCKSRILLNIPQCTGQLPQLRNFWPQMSILPRTEKPFSRVKLMLLVPQTML